MLEEWAPSLVPALQDEERTRLAELEARIGGGLSHFVEVGLALAEVRNGLLYRETHATFEEYCDQRWGMARRTAYQFIDSSEVLMNVRNCAHSADIGGPAASLLLPVNEAQARPLVALKEPEAQRAAWTEVLARAEEDDGAVTAALVADVVKDFKIVRKEAPDVFEALKSGEMDLSSALIEATDRAAAKAARPPRRRRVTGGYVLPPVKREAGRFEVLWADPPWAHDFIEQEADPKECRYEPMSVDAIRDHTRMGERVVDKATADCILFLWSTPSRLPDALAVLGAWGFDYQAHIVWNKETHGAGVGMWVRADHELLLIGTRGRPALALPRSRPSSVIEEKRKRPGERPARFYEIVEEMFPKAARLCLFNGGPERVGWEEWNPSRQEFAGDLTEDGSDP